jgi:hypothetical protein
MATSTIDKFVARLPHKVQEKLTPRSVEIWAFIYGYIKKQRYADTLDEDFMTEINNRFGIQARSVSAHLRKMYQKKLISRWEGKVLPGQIKHSLTLFFGSSPTRVVRYTLPGQRPPLRLHRPGTDPNWKSQI